MALKGMPERFPLYGGPVPAAEMAYQDSTPKDKAVVLEVDADGLDEISTTGHTKVSECRDGAVNTFYIHPADFGVPKATLAALKGGDAARNASIVRMMLEGAPGPPRDIVLFNAGAALFIAGRAASIIDGIRQAGAAIDDGRAAAALEAMAAASKATDTPAERAGA